MAFACPALIFICSSSPPPSSLSCSGLHPRPVDSGEAPGPRTQWRTHRSGFVAAPPQTYRSASGNPVSRYRNSRPAPQLAQQRRPRRRKCLGLLYARRRQTCKQDETEAAAGSPKPPRTATCQPKSSSALVTGRPWRRAKTETEPTSGPSWPAPPETRTARSSPSSRLPHDPRPSRQPSNSKPKSGTEQHESNAKPAAGR